MCVCVCVCVCLLKHISFNVLWTAFNLCASHKWYHPYFAFHVLVQPKFRRYFVLPLARSSSNSPRSFQRFRRTLKPNFIKIRQRLKNFPIDPHCKNCPLSATLGYNFAESGQFLQWGSMGKFFICCQIKLKFRLRVRPKRWNDRGEFELDRARSKIISPKIRLH